MPLIPSVTNGIERFCDDYTESGTCEPANEIESGNFAETPLERADIIEAATPELAPTFVDLGYEPFPKQQEFHASRAKYRLFGGAAGPGKSKALLMEAILQAHEVPGANTLLLRRTFSEMEQTLLLYFRRDIPRELYKSYNESKHVVTWWNGSTTRFGYCQSEADVYQYQGAEFLFIGIDELTLFTLRQWQFLTSRNRCPVPGAFPCMAGATNPGNIGHAWVKSLWIEKQAASGMEHPEEFDGSDYDFIPARVTDNPIYAGDANYLKTLRALPSHLKRAFLDGDWDVYAGQYFDRFDCSRHVVRAERIEWKPWWPRWISVDWGFEHPAAVYWHAQTPISTAIRDGSVGAQPASADLRHAASATTTAANAYASPAGAGYTDAYGAPADPSRGQERRVQDDNPRRIVTYREFVTHRTSPRDLARAIVERSLLNDHAHQQQVPGRPQNGLCRNDNVVVGAAGVDNSYGNPIGDAGGREKIDAIYLSPDAFARRTDEASIADQMGDIFAAAGLPRPVPADNDRVGGWMLMYQMLDAGEWLLTENCVELIRTIPNLVRDPARVEDIEKMDGDDPADAARYGLKSRYGAGRSWQTQAPVEQRIAERITSADPFGRSMQIRKFQIEEKRGARPVSFLHRPRHR
jgi:Terminase large subunit, T4likevirus-type, N-terminal